MPETKATQTKSKPEPTHLEKLYETYQAPVILDRSDQDSEELTKQAQKLLKPARLNKADKEVIDPDPGYSVEQVDHMREYWGIGKDSDKGSDDTESEK